MNCSVRISDLDGEGLQTRVELNGDTVEEYAEVYRQYGSHDTVHGMPAVSAVYNAATHRYWLTDGFHRVAAAKRAGFDTITADCVNGTFCDALRAALASNARHGLRRTNADKRRALQIAWENREKLFGGDPSTAVLAEACGVCEMTVRRFRDEVSTLYKVQGWPDTPVKRIGRDGRVRGFPELPSRYVDGLGQVVPGNLIAVFADRSCYKALLAVSRAVNGVDAARMSAKAGFLLGQGEIEKIRQAVHAMRRNLPYAVCTGCAGGGCSLCDSRGYLTRHRYDLLPGEFKISNQHLDTNIIPNSNNSSSSNNSSETVNGSDAANGGETPKSGKEAA